MKIMNEEEWEQRIAPREEFIRNQNTQWKHNRAMGRDQTSVHEGEPEWPFGEWHWEARTDWGCDYVALVHEEGNPSDMRSMMVAFIALEDDGTYSVIEPDVPITSDLGLPARGSRYCLGLDATGFASPEGARKYVETLLTLDGELNHCWNVRQ